MRISLKGRTMGPFEFTSEPWASLQRPVAGICIIVGATAPHVEPDRASAASVLFVARCDDIRDTSALRPQYERAKMAYGAELLMCHVPKDPSADLDKIVADLIEGLNPILNLESPTSPA